MHSSALPDPLSLLQNGPDNIFGGHQYSWL